jgi:hypothetical protein
MGGQSTTGAELALYGSSTPQFVRAATWPVVTVHA